MAKITASGRLGLLDALERGEGAYAGVGILDASVNDAGLARMHEAGFRGARFNYVGHLGSRPTHDDVVRVMDRIAPLGWHLVFHFDGGALAEEAEFLADLPCTIVIDHMARLDAAAGIGQPGFATLLDLAARPNVWTKISAADRMAATLADAVPFMAALVDAAPDRSMWGTDWPHPNSRWMPDDGDLLDLLARAVPDAAARAAILRDNPARLYAFT